MRPKSVLLLCALAAAGALAFWALGQADPRPQGAVDDAPNATATASTSSNRPAGPRTSIGVDARTAIRATSAPRPQPADADWIDLRVVDGAGAPVAGADVYWHHGEAEALVYGDEELAPDRVEFLWQVPELTSERYGWRTTSDERGVARITVTEHTEVSGARAGLWGTVELSPHTPAPTGGHRLVLLPDDGIDVRVVGHDGKPCADVPVTILVLDADDDMQSTLGRAPLAFTDDAGEARIRHVQRHARELRDDPDLVPLSLRTFVRPLLPALEQRGVEVSLTAPPRERITLRLPACGSVRAQTRLAGSPISARFPIALTADDDQHDDRYGGYAVQRPGDDGWAWFHHVPVQMHLTAYSLAANRVSTDFAGPQLHGQVVDAVIVPEAGNTLLVGRALTHDGAPVARTHLHIEFVGRVNLPYWRQCETDDEGNFLFSLAASREPQDAEFGEAILRTAEDDWTIGRARIDGRKLQPGTHDIGDVVLQAGEPFVCGRLVCNGAPFTKECWLWIEAVPDESNGDAEWRRYVDANVRVQSDGTFAAHGRTAPGRYRLALYSDECGEREPIEFALGTEDLIVELDPAFPLSANLALPDGTPHEQVRCRLVHAGDVQFSEHVEDRLEVAPRHLQADRSVAQWRGVPPGVYALEVTLWTQRAPSIRVEDIVVPPPPGGDPQLSDIDLRRRVQVVDVELFDEDGEPSADEGALFEPGLDLAAPWYGVPVRGARARVAVPAGPVHLVARIQGHRPAEIRGRGTTLTARLYRWPDVTFRIAGPRLASADVEVDLVITPQTATTQEWHAPEFLDDLQHLLGFAQRLRPVRDGVVVAPLAEGAYELALRVDDVLLDVRPAQVFAGPHEIAVEIPESERRRARAALSDDRR